MSRIQPRLTSNASLAICVGIVSLTTACSVTHAAREATRVRHYPAFDHERPVRPDDPLQVAIDQERAVDTASLPSGTLLESLPLFVTRGRLTQVKWPDLAGKVWLHAGRDSTQLLLLPAPELVSQSLKARFVNPSGAPRSEIDSLRHVEATFLAFLNDSGYRSFGIRFTCVRPLSTASPWQMRGARDHRCMRPGEDYQLSIAACPSAERDTCRDVIPEVFPFRMERRNLSVGIIAGTVLMVVFLWASAG